MENLAFKIRRLRELRNYSQEYVALELGISVKTYQRLEAGRAALSVQKAALLARVFGISFDELHQFNPDTAQFEKPSNHVVDGLHSLQKENAALLERLEAVRKEKTQLLKIIEHLLEKRALPPE